MPPTPAEQWYCAILVFESRIPEDPADTDTSVDLQYRLVRAPDAESAYQRALALGRRGELSYPNADGATCSWTFAGLRDLRLLDDQELQHGAEIYGHIERGAAADHIRPRSELSEFMSESEE